MSKNDFRRGVEILARYNLGVLVAMVFPCSIWVFDKINLPPSGRDVQELYELGWTQESYWRCGERFLPVRYQHGERWVAQIG